MLTYAFNMDNVNHGRKRYDKSLCATLDKVARHRLRTHAPKNAVDKTIKSLDMKKKGPCVCDNLHL